jgi:hypothetical protein
MGLGISCWTTANEYLPNRRKRLEGAGGEKSVGHSGVDEDGHRSVHIVSEVRFKDNGCVR